VTFSRQDRGDTGEPHPAIIDRLERRPTLAMLWRAIDAAH
jgi:hypothetical protein